MSLTDFIIVVHIGILFCRQGKVDKNIFFILIIIQNYSRKNTWFKSIFFIEIYTKYGWKQLQIILHTIGTIYKYYKDSY